MIFAVLILFVLWLFLFVFLKSYYADMKTREIKKVASYITHGYGSKKFASNLGYLAFSNNMCIEIIDIYGYSLYSYEMMAGECIIHNDYGVRLFGWKNELLNSEDNEFYYVFNDEKLQTKMLIYGGIIGDKDNIQAFVFLNCSLEPSESTLRIIREQFYYIAFFILALAFVITLFISKKISSPIVKITKTAQKFAKGDYSVTFDGGGYSEAQQLASVLNYAGKEISKVDGLRRELISNISHDLRTPLTIIKAYAEMIRDLSGNNPNKREQHVNVIIDESDRLSNLVNGLLELSKFESGNTNLEISEFSIHDKIDEVLNRYKIFEERDGYNFVFEKDEDMVVKADVAKIEQVLYNFINNAVNYTGEDKKITVRQINKATSVRIEIIDTGEGIPQDRLALIFDRYYRDVKNEREVVGTGLGLSIIREILKLHEFPFGVYSELGKGSTFWFEIAKQ